MNGAVLSLAIANRNRRFSRIIRLKGIADTDDDRDGVLDTADAFPLDSSKSGDTDGDGIDNNADTESQTHKSLFP